MSNPKIKKLTLKAEVLRTLDARELESTHGGVIQPPKSLPLMGRCVESMNAVVPCHPQSERGGICF